MNKNESEVVELEHYFESEEEFDEFTLKVKNKFKELKENQYENVVFNINSTYYTEYGEVYTNIEFEFEFEREFTLEEKKEIEEKEKFDLESSKIFKELNGILSNNSIGSIINNKDLREKYLNGKLIFK